MCIFVGLGCYGARVGRVTSLNDGWQFSCADWQKSRQKVGYSTVEWQRASVPGHVHLDLVDCGIIGDPYEALQELGCQWVDQQDWHFRTEFEFAPDAELPTRILRFDGLDTVCQIYLNDQLVAEHDNMFVALEVDVTHQLLVGKNALRVEFASATRIGRARQASYFAAAEIAPNTVRFDARAFVRKAQYMFGWDWGPCLISTGIWQPVALLEFRSRILDVWVTQRHLVDGAVELEIHSQCAGEGKLYHFVEGFAAPVEDGQVLRIDHPRLWWPNGMGTQELYRIRSILVPGALTANSTAEPLDAREQSIGLRVIELLRMPDAYGETFQFTVNGRHLYALGANWIPDDSFPSRVDAARLGRQLSAAQEMGMNMLRVWGGGLYESDAFYSLCDRLGLLVWQDFPYACSYYPDDAAACAASAAEATAAILRLRNHASLAIWCGNNENSMMRDGGWEGAALHPARFHGERIYDDTLPSILAKLDPARPYIASSPIGTPEANCDGNGDQHYWDVWHGRGDWHFYNDSRARFCSEFGFASAPSPVAWRKMSAAFATAPVQHPIARWHNKTGKGYDTFVGFVELHYPKSETLADFSYYSQLNQRDALRFGIEHFRRSAFCRGTLIWQLNDCWPVQSWSVIDAAFCKKAAAYELERLYAPLLACLERTGDVIQMWGVLDNASCPIDAAFHLEVRSLEDGRLLYGCVVNATLSPGERRVLASLSIAQYDASKCIVVAEVAGRSSHLLLCEPKELRLCAGELIVYRDVDGLIVETELPVVDLWLFDEAEQCTMLDNFVTMAAGGRQLLRCEGTPTRLTARSLAGFHACRFASQ